MLGEGSFGRVYLGFDEELKRRVAIKVPTPGRFRSPEDAEAYLTEARLVAGLDHPNIVPVHDVGRTGDGSVYVVSKYIAGCTLREWIKAGRPAHDESARLLAAVAAALQHAHERRLIHRDVKPGNILIEDRTGAPYVTDFGLAVREDDCLGDEYFVGTPAYMSPEQARGEGHRLDARSDIFSLGVVFYELLTGTKPFGGGTANEFLHQLLSIDPPRPRELDRSIPAELERICLKMLSRRASDRHPTAAELADDLRHWQQAPEHRRIPLRVVPRGLRSFDAHDADFFLDLLPGPKDREGLPESIRFWKSRIEQTDPDQTFSVGMLYGPSGCGKSSLVKAGLLPRLSRDVVTLYVEATPTDTEARILRGLRKRVPDLPDDLNLVETFARLRRGNGPKVLVVLDQFEQWLHANPLQPEAELPGALRQCDGGRVQAIVMVRDDFAMAAARFMDALDVPILQGQNFATVDLFDLDHARKVLIRFGQAFERLPGETGELSDEQQRFVSAVAAALARNGQVVPLRLALFAEMVKSRPWTPATLKDVGGAEGIGVTFLEETFSSRTANPNHRLHQPAAREVLKALLPESGTDLKGHMRSHEELLHAAGYQNRPADFHQLLRILDGELRLISPTDPAAAQSDDESVRRIDPGLKHYQLTHDYLVPALRSWLTRKQKETARGRAELRLTERAAVWSGRPESRNLPSLVEWAGIRALTENRRWTDAERSLMRSAARFHAIRLGAIVSVLAVVLAAASWYITAQRTLDQRRRAELLVDAVLRAPPEAVPYALQRLEPLREQAVPILTRRFEDEIEPAHRLHAAVALAEFGHVRQDFLLESIAGAAHRECANIAAALGRSRQTALPAVQDLASRAESAQEWPHKARLAVVALHLGDAGLVRDMFRLRPDPVQRTVLIETLSTWHGPVDRFLDIDRAFDDPAFRSGLCLGIGSIPADNLPAPERNAWKALLLEWAEHQPDAATHSAATWALRRWNVAPAVPAPAGQISDGRDWYINSAGLTMLRIPAGRFVRQTPTPNDSSRAESEQTVMITRAVWFSDREVSRAAFEEFMGDPAYPADRKPEDWQGADPARSPTREHPVQNVSWIDAVLFCNWLSDREGLTRCYQAIGGGWEPAPGADGYRLPSEAEWEYACRAGTVTRYACGNDETLLHRYLVCLANQTGPCGSRMPNAWGLFDAHGNVYEWCQDWYGSYGRDAVLRDPSGPADGDQRVLRGGAFDYAPEYATSAIRARNRPAYRSLTIGMRVARTDPGPTGDK